MNLTIGSLFSGIGGLEQGLCDALGAETAWQVECQPYPLALLTREYPGALRWRDVREVSVAQPAFARVAGVDVLCGGSPCQDLSLSGPRLGLAGARSGLWFHFARLVDECRPRLVVWENVGGALCQTRKQPGALGIPAATRVLMDLDTLGYNAWWTTCLAASVGAPHLRLRLFVLGVRRGAGPLAVRPSPHPRTVLDGSTWPAPPGLPPFPWEPPRELRSGREGGALRKPRLQALGNAVVPQVAFAVGTAAARLLGAPPVRANPARGPEAWGRHLADRFSAHAAGRGMAHLFPLRGALEPCGASRGDLRCRPLPPSGIAVDGHAWTPQVPDAPLPRTCSRSGCEGEEDPFALGELGLWPTAEVRDFRSGKQGEATRSRAAGLRGGGKSRPLSEVAAPGGVLNASWVDGLMGWRPGFTDLEPGQRPRRGEKGCY